MMKSMVRRLLGVVLLSTLCAACSQNADTNNFPAATEGKIIISGSLSDMDDQRTVYTLDLSNGDMQQLFSAEETILDMKYAKEQNAVLLLTQNTVQYVNLDTKERLLLPQGQTDAPPVSIAVFPHSDRIAVGFQLDENQYEIGIYQVQADGIERTQTMGFTSETWAGDGIAIDSKEGFFLLNGYEAQDMTISQVSIADPTQIERLPISGSSPTFVMEDSAVLYCSKNALKLYSLSAQREQTLFAAEDTIGRVAVDAAGNRACLMLSQIDIGPRNKGFYLIDLTDGTTEKAVLPADGYAAPLAIDWMEVIRDREGLATLKNHLYMAGVTTMLAARANAQNRCGANEKRKRVER